VDALLFSLSCWLWASSRHMRGSCRPHFVSPTPESHPDNQQLDRTAEVHELDASGALPNSGKAPGARLVPSRSGPASPESQDFAGFSRRFNALRVETTRGPVFGLDAVTIQRHRRLTEHMLRHRVLVILTATLLTLVEATGQAGTANSVAARHDQRYSIYNLALALIAARPLSPPADRPRGALDKLLALQDDSGGWITDYDAAGRRLGVANVETTSLAILALEPPAGPESTPPP